MPVNTKRAIAASFKKLLSKRELNKITVKDIVEDCGVNRQTFYYHFHNVYDLMEWFFQDDAETLLGGQSDYKDWEKGLRMLVDTLQENRAMISHVYHSMSHKVVVDYIKRILWPYMLRIVESEVEEIQFPVEQKNVEFVAELLTLAVVGIITEWIDNGKKQLTEERLEKFLKAVHGSVPFMLKNLQESRAPIESSQKG